MKKDITRGILLPAMALCAAAACAAANEDSARVTVANFVRAESDTMIRANMAMMDTDFGEITHLRTPTTPENQPVIRMNQDTLYSASILDLSPGAGHVARGRRALHVHARGEPGSLHAR